MTADPTEQDRRFYSWNRQLARVCLRPFAKTALAPNHITALRWLLGFVSCYLFATGDMISGGLTWILSAFLDRCDGEFARMTGKSSKLGHWFDMSGDIVFNALVFASLALGLVDEPVMLDGVSWIVLGLVAGGGVVLAALLAELNEQGMAQGEKTFDGIWGFDFDDLIYLIGILPMLGLAPYMVMGAAVFAPIAALVVGGKYLLGRIGGQ